MSNAGASTTTGDGKAISSSTYILKIDNHYLNVYEIKLIAGRNFYQNILADSASFILNEAAVKAFSWKTPEDAINKPFKIGRTDGRVVGIVKDFHFNSLRHPVEPVVMFARTPQRADFSQITVKVDMSKPQQAINWIAQNWKSYFPDALLQYDFIDKKLNDQYQAEQIKGVTCANTCVYCTK